MADEFKKAMATIMDPGFHTASLTPTPVPAASERMTAEDLAAEIEGVFVGDLRVTRKNQDTVIRAAAMIRTLSARAEAAEARAERARAEALEDAAKVVEGQSTAANYMPLSEPMKMLDWVTRRDFRIAGLIRALLTAPPPTAD